VPVPDEVAQAVAEGRLLTWEQAVAIDHPALEGWEKPRGMPYCESVDLDYDLAPDEEPRDDAPECYVPPEEQTLYFLPPSVSPDSSFLDDELAPGGYRFGGSKTKDGYRTEGGQNLAEE